MQSTTVRKAVRYRRVPGQSQKDNFSLTSQNNGMIKHCEHEGLLSDRMFTDIASGLSTRKRPQLLLMGQYSLDPANGITDMVFFDLDRFTRNVAEFFAFTKPLLAAGITLHIAIDGEKYDYHSEEKWHQRLIAAQAESKRISKRTKVGQRQATTLGYYMGKPPWGYRIVHDPDGLNERGEKIECGKLELDPKTWDDCLKFWELAGNGYASMKLTKYMNQHNIPSPRGGPWKSNCTLYIMKNRTYLGELSRGVNPRSRLPGPKENAPPIIVEHAHKAAVEPEVFKKVGEGIRNRHREQGPTRSHSSPNPLSDRIKCGECWIRGYDSNLHVYRNNGVIRLRCSRKHMMGKEECTFTGARLDELLEAITGRLTTHFLTEDILGSVIDGVTEESRRYLGEQETGKSGITARMKIVDDEINTIGDVLRAAGTKAPNLHSLIDRLKILEDEKADLQKQIAQIAEVSEEALLFVNNKEGIIETALSRKTLTEPEDPEAIRELLNIFIERVYLFADKTGVIHYDLPIHSAGPEGTPAKETIYLEKKRGPKASESCVFDGTTGPDPW